MIETIMSIPFYVIGGLICLFRGHKVPDYAEFKKFGNTYGLCKVCMRQLVKENGKWRTVSKKELDEAASLNGLRNMIESGRKKW